MDFAKMCHCNKCNINLIDTNPQTNAKDYPIERVDLLSTELIGLGEDAFIGCPKCLSDENLADGVMGYDIDDPEIAFVVHGTYSCGFDGYEVELNKSCDEARLRSYDSNGVASVTDWLEIETIIDPNFEPDCDNERDEFISVIDPYGHNVPLNEVMRVKALQVVNKE